jgi:geranylgeranyl pyrophosphate synthase
VAEQDIDRFMADTQNRVSHDFEQLFLPVVPERFRPVYAYALMDDNASRLRPALVQATADGFGLGQNIIKRPSRGVELVHGASLIIDDSPAHDNSPARRGKPAVHVEFGTGKALTAAVAMLNSAYHEFSVADSERHLNGDLVEYVTEKVEAMCEGQDMDLDTFGEAKQEDQEPTTLEELDEIASRKTASAFEIAVAGVAIINRSPHEVREGLEKYARLLGIAYQVKDDLLDDLESPEGLGKTPGLDTKNGKTNYVSLLGREDAKEHFQDYSLMAVQTLEGLSSVMDVGRLREIVGYIGRKVAHQ